MCFPDTYFRVSDHLYKITCNKLSKEGITGIVAEMCIEEVEYTV